MPSSYLKKKTRLIEQFCDCFITYFLESFFAFHIGIFVRCFFYHYTMIISGEEVGINILFLVESFVVCFFFFLLT